MTNYQRITAKVFGETATATGNDPEIAQFGSALAGTYNGTTDVATIQNLSAWSNGFIDCVTPTQQFPPLPEMTGFGKVVTHQQAYLLQKGIPEWDSGTIYYSNDFCKVDNIIYYSLQNNNQNHNPTTSTTYWRAYGDGAWQNVIGSNINLTSVTAVGTYDINLSSILPSDANDYECLCRYNFERRDNSAEDTGIKILSSDGAKTWVWEHVEGDPQLSTNYIRKSGQFIAIVGSSRKLKIDINTKPLNNNSIDLIMYRRCTV